MSRARATARGERVLAIATTALAAAICIAACIAVGIALAWLASR